MARIREFDIDRALDRAMDLFWRKGYAETSLQDLLKELSIGSGSFYAAFGSKEQLYIRALDRYTSLQGHDLETALDGTPGIRSAVHGVLSALIEADLTDPTRGCLVVSAATQCGGRPEAADRVSTAIRQVESFLTGALERARARGEISPEKDPRELARFLTTFIQGIRVVGGARMGREFLEDALSTAMRALD
ncbi:TetR/AcrR family transcriptional regulator [Streptomyces arenae]|uniref:TetR/AcrR family transcriptional regulator n=1 Tax=Streptomyces arenae TaxID=29301 RepID=UPI002659D8D5|nr:TetR/AcrR family transcriptional regulator [Streptomyces arenae]MCG7205867.1 TetR/AcrR family transcriptional regulator [Streptomyces arenae]